MEKGKTAVKGEGTPSPMMGVPQSGMTTTSQGLSMTTGDRWFNQLPVVGPRSQFTGRNYQLWTRHIQTVLKPRNLEDHLTNKASPQEVSQYKRWIVEKEILYTWILDSTTTELANCFVEYSIVKEIWDAAQQYHSKENGKAKLAQLVSS